jgi:hypothetical protein
MAGSSEHGDEPSGSGATDFVRWVNESCVRSKIYFSRVAEEAPFTTKLCPATKTNLYNSGIVLKL